MNQQTPSLRQQLFHMTLPMLIGMLAVSSCQLVDSAFIGQLGAQPLAVVGFSIPIYQLIIGIQVGLGIATTAIVSTALGANKNTYAKQLGAMIIVTGFILISILCLILWLAQEVIVVNLGGDTALFPFVREYWFPWLISCWLGAMLYFGFSIFRAHGETRFPGIVLVLVSIINMVLDPLFIFVLDIGLAGAAWATVCAFCTGCIIIFAGVHRKDLIRFPDTMTTIRAGLRRLLSFMAPSMLSQFIPPLSGLIATGIVAIYGNDAVAAWGLASRIEFFSIIIVLSLTMAMPPIIGKLRGSNQLTQIDQLMRIAVSFVMLSQLALTVITVLFSSPLSSALTTDSSIADILHEYLWLVPLSYGGLGISMLIVSACSAMGMPALALVISALRLFSCYLPLLWLGSEIAGLTGLFIGAMTGNLIAGYLSWQLYKKRLTLLHSQYPKVVNPLAENLQTAS